MKAITLNVFIPDFCPKDCKMFEVHESKLYGDGKPVLRAYSCRNEEMCKNLKSIIETEGILKAVPKSMHDIIINGLSEYMK